METYPSKNIAITWIEKGSIARNLFLALGFAILTALSAQVRIVIPISPVPITGQTFVVLLSGLILGSTFGAISMLMYLFIGCLLYTSPSPRDMPRSRMPSSA